MDGLLAEIGCGTTLFWVLAIVVFAVVSIVVFLLIRNRRMNRLLSEPVLKIQQYDADSGSNDEELEQILADTGYAYDWEQNIFYSVMYPWQRDMGYCSLYDEWATSLGLVFDCEPVRFNYNGKKWLIELWKGQYGITVGGEIGVYNTAEEDLDIPGVFQGTFYHSAVDDETLHMAFVLRKGNRVLFNRADWHWWLTGFVLGEYSHPSSLMMDAAVTFRDEKMRNVFIKALLELGYRSDEISYSENTVEFTFAKPRSKQPWMRHGLIDYFAMYWNKGLVARYREITQGQTNMFDILMTLKDKSPLLYGLAINVGKQLELFRAYREIEKYLS